ncbi:NACHT, LRR and PYD domains-containing protein 1 homolog isoform X1 [Alosa alosa]|nr:NACHT, LRR and PYD domains-containing protein 1 homolog isoform X1 [Alosa alosa]
METGVPVYKHRSPSGSFECTASGLRWVCAVEVSLQYHFSDPHVFRAELAMLQYEPIGPLMDIKVLSGELLEAHLPHFACLEGSDSSLREAVRVLHGVNSSVTLEKCELTRFHAKLLKPSFSLTEVLVKIGIPMKAHLDVLIYRTRVTPLVLFTYIVPRDASMIQAVEQDLREFQDKKKIKKHRPDISIWMNSKCSLKASCHDSKTSPQHITFKYIRPPDLFEVVIKNADCFDLELISEGQSIWKATLESFEFGETGEMEHSHEMPSAASRHSQVMTHREAAYTSRSARTDEEKGKMASMSHEDRLFMIRPDLIKKTSGALL